MSRQNVKIKGLGAILVIITMFMIGGNLFAQNDFFPRGVYSNMETINLDSLTQVQRAGFNVIRAGKHIHPDEDILIEAANHDMFVSFDGGDYVHNYSSAQYNIYEAELEPGDVPDPNNIEWFYWYAHETGREDETHNFWYSNPNEHAQGYMLQGPYHAHHLPATVGLWHEQMIGRYGMDFEAAYRLRMGTVGEPDPNFPVVDLEIEVWVEDTVHTPHYKTLVDSTLYRFDFTEGVWDTFRVYYHLTHSDSEKFVRHNLYWHENRELWVDWVEVKDTTYGVHLFAGEVDDDIRNEADTYNRIPATADLTLFRWYLWDEPRRIQYRAQNRINALITEPTVYRQVPGMTAFAESTPSHTLEEYLSMANPNQLYCDIYPLLYHSGAVTNEILQQELDSLTIGLAQAKAMVDSVEPPLELYFVGQAHAFRSWDDDNSQWVNKLRNPTVFELRCLNFMGLLYGAKGIFWFTYESRYQEVHHPIWWPKDYWFSIEYVDDDRVPGDEVAAQQTTEWHTRGLVERSNIDDETTEYDIITDKWTELQQFNEILDQIGSDLLALDWQSAFTSGDQPGADPAPGGSIVQDVTNGDYIEAGNFTHQSTSEPYFMLVNRRCEGADIQTITVTLESGSSRRLIEDVLASRTPWGGNANRVAYRILESGETQFSVTLNPGEGRLFRVTDGLSGALTGNRYWSGELFVANNLTVGSDDTLTIYHNSRVEFDAGRRLTIYGTLQANGNASESITFTRSGSSGSWSGIWIEDDSSRANLDYCIVEYSSYGIHLKDMSQNVTIDHATLRNNSFGFVAESSGPFTIQNSTIENNYDGLWIKSKANNSGYSYIQNNTIRYNTRYGVFLHLDTRVRFGYDYIMNNHEHGLYCRSNVHANLRGSYGHNWIHDNESSGVATASNAWPLLGTDYQNPPKDYYGYNHIYDNQQYEIKNANGGSQYLKAERNYWSASETIPVWPDNIYGLVDYDPVLPELPGGFMTASTPYELELIEQYEAAISGYGEQLKLDPNANDAEFAVSGLVRCYEALDRFHEIIKLLDDLIIKYPKTTAARAAKDNSLPYLMRGDAFDLAIERAKSLHEFYQDDKARKAFYTYILASIYDMRSEGKECEDRDMAAAYYQTLIDKYPESDFAFWAKMQLNEFADAALTKPLTRGTNITVQKVQTFSLEQNYPNPFNPTTMIRYQLPQDVKVSLTIHNLRGQIIRTLFDGYQEAGIHSIQWDGQDEFGNLVASGIYVYHLIAGEFVKSKKLVFVK